MKEELDREFRVRATAKIVAERMNNEGSSDCCTPKWVVEPQLPRDRKDTAPRWKVVRYES